MSDDLKQLHRELLDATPEPVPARKRADIAAAMDAFEQRVASTKADVSRPLRHRLTDWFLKPHIAAPLGALSFGVVAMFVVGPMLGLAPGQLGDLSNSRTLDADATMIDPDAPYLGPPETVMLLGAVPQPDGESLFVIQDVESAADLVNDKSASVSISLSGEFTFPIDVYLAPTNCPTGIQCGTGLLSLLEEAQDARYVWNDALLCRNASEAFQADYALIARDVRGVTSSAQHVLFNCAPDQP